MCRKDYLPSWMLAIRLINWERSRCGIRTRSQEKMVAERHEEQEAEEAEAIRRRKKEEEARLDKHREEYQKEQDERMIDFYAAMAMKEGVEKGQYCKQELKILYFRQMADQLEAQEEENARRTEQQRRNEEQEQQQQDQGGAQQQQGEE